jgi:hypothetical protein
MQHLLAPSVRIHIYLINEDAEKSSENVLLKRLIYYGLPIQ